MKQLTRNEIIELITDVIYKNTKLSSKSSEITASSILRNLEKAGVLMLIDDVAEILTNDVLESAENETQARKYARVVQDALARVANEPAARALYKIIQRNNVPVYQCKKEVTNV